jgi:hypothetical protein
LKKKMTQYYVAPTGMNTWAGPYRSLQHATNAIARKLQKEFTERNAKLEAFHAR